MDVLTERRDRRVGCLIAFASPGNRIELFPEQAEYYLRRHAGDKISVKLWKLHALFESSEPDQEAFEIALRNRFNLDPVPLATALSRALTQFRSQHFSAVGQGQIPLLFLDWGVWRSPRPAVISVVLQAWAAFCERELSRACPSSLRLLSYVALESNPTDHPTITEQVTTMRRSYRRKQNMAFYIEDPAHLNVVSEAELEDFVLDHAEALGCPSPICDKLAQHMYRKTREEGQEGRYDRLLALNQQLLAEGPHTMLARWERECR